MNIIFDYPERVLARLKSVFHGTEYQSSRVSRPPHPEKICTMHRSNFLKIEARNNDLLLWLFGCCGPCWNIKTRDRIVVAALARARCIPTASRSRRASQSSRSPHSNFFFKMSIAKISLILTIFPLVNRISLIAPTI